MFNYSKIKLLAGLLTLAATIGHAYAVPANPRPRTFIQPDGTQLTYYLRGDENHHIYVSEDGYLLSLKDNAMYYADVDASGDIEVSDLIAKPVSIRTDSERAYLRQVNMPDVLQRLTQKAQQATPRIARMQQPRLTATPKLAAQDNMPHTPGLFDDRFPCVGQPHVLVVLVEYSDVKFNLDDPYDYFERLLNEPGFSDYGGTGCVSDFFADNSNGQYTPSFDLYGPVTLNNKMSYYGANDSSGSDKRAYQMIIEACQKLDDTVDFSQYDCDGDGYIDNVFVYYAGLGEASYGPADSVWPHSWNITYATDTPYIFDGVRLDRYACSNEWENKRPDGIGTFVHEFSHVMGLPDLYATSYSSAFTPAEWSVMDVGSYNNDGMTPPNYSAFERCALGWLQPDIIDQACNISLPDITHNKACYIATEKTNEYFLIENRQKKGWDKYLPGHGMLVWHIDYKEYVWYNNEVNNNSSHQYVDLIEADNTRNDKSRSGDSFPGASNITSFTSETTPAFKSWSGKAIELPITGITEADGIISFMVDGGDDVELLQVTAHPATDITATTMTVSWDSDPMAKSYIVSVYTRDDSNEPQYLVGWDHCDVGDVSNVVINDLEPETTYYYTVASKRGNKYGAESAELSATTAKAPLHMLKPTILEATEIQDQSFTANWEPIEGADRYYVNVYTKDTTTEETLYCGFTMDENPIPEGWESNTKQTYASDSFCGKSTPALRFAADGDYICSPTMAVGIAYVSFWHRGSLNTSDNSIVVSALVHDRYVEIGRYEIRQTSGGKTIEISDIPAHATRIKIEMSRVIDKGSVSIDDITVRGVTGDTHIPVPEYEMYPVGNVTSAVIDGLTSDTEYYYSVIGSDGTDMTQESDEAMVVTTGHNSAIDIIPCTGIKINGLTVTVEAPVHTSISIYDMMGRVISTTNTGNTGRSPIILPDHGVYMIRIANSVYKVNL